MVANGTFVKAGLVEIDLDNFRYAIDRTEDREVCERIKEDDNYAE